VDLGRKVIAMEKHPVKKVVETLNISRSNQYQTKRPRPARYKRKDDDESLGEIKAVCKERATYGVRRVAAIVNRKRKKEGLCRRNKKKIERLMRINGLLLPKSGSREERAHDGKVITLRSDTRYCSDIFNIKCWNGEVICVAFSLDCHDRESISYVAEPRPLVHQDIMKLMDQTVSERFGSNIERLPHVIEWLSDNGPQYIAKETKEYGRTWGLAIITTPSYSPESNGMAEVFVKTFKRDYVYTNELPNALTVLRKLPEWFWDYNENAPHSGLKFLSPKEYRKSTNQVSV